MRSQEVHGRSRVHASDAERQRSRRQRESSQERAVRLQADRLRHQRGQERETSQERTARRQEDSERHRELRERESSHERTARHQEDSERHRELRARETSQERTARHQEDSERHRELRARETSQERAARHQEESDRHRQLRERDSSQERAARHQEDAERHRRSRTDEDPEERRVRLTTDAEGHRRRRSLPSRMLGIALGGRVPVSSYLGRLSHRCQHCGALHFRCEVKPQHRDRFLECCDLGRFKLNYFEQFPDDLRRLFIYNPTNAEEQQRIRRNSMGNIRTFNSALAMASMGAQVDTLRDVVHTVLGYMDKYIIVWVPFIPEKESSVNTGKSIFWIQQWLQANGLAIREMLNVIWD
ncbi:hypothetical protein GCK32_022749 [Trichostrongylus colubriformis]|uniref:Uncharacterized protein n=1 Tax=Trichostrongylus colubriformis TaxID=6319 RepID=A0AAN8EYQ8_TRICO